MKSEVHHASQIVFFLESGTVSNNQLQLFSFVIVAPPFVSHKGLMTVKLNKTVTSCSDRLITGYDLLFQEQCKFKVFAVDLVSIYDSHRYTI